jgi:putative intracellular protease/amidase
LQHEEIVMKVLFIVTGSDKYTWMSEVTHPFWHLTEHGVEVDFFTPEGGAVLWDPASDPGTVGSREPDDLVTKGFLTDRALVAKLGTTGRLKDADLDSYDAVHVAGGLGAVYDLYPNEDVASALEHFWVKDKVIGAICHGVIALANNPDRIRGRKVTGYSLAEDREVEELYKLKIPYLPQTTIEEAGVVFRSAAPHQACVVVDGKLVTGQNQFSASDYGVILYHMIVGGSPIAIFAD